MVEPDLTPQQQIGMHAVSVAICLDFLQETDGALQFINALQHSMSFFRERDTFKDALMNEDPLYIAGDILKKDVDALSKETWLKYHNIMAAVASNINQDSGLHFLDAIGFLCKFGGDLKGFEVDLSPLQPEHGNGTGLRP